MAFWCILTVHIVYLGIQNFLPNIESFVTCGYLIMVSLYIVTRRPLVVTNEFFVVHVLFDL
jgi:hypothetical protein